MRSRFSILFTISLLALSPAIAQEGPLKDVSVEELVDRLAPTQGIRLRGIAIAPRSVDLAIEFAYDSAELTEDAKRQLATLGAALQSDALRAQRFTVAGHTDAAGSDEYNERLSTARAAAVVDYLRDNHGIDVSRIDAFGLGETRLLFPDRPEDARNRRVEISTR